MPTPISWDVYARDRASRTFNTVGSAATKNSGLVGKFGTVLVGAFTGAALYHGATRLIGALGDVAQGAADDEAAARRMALQFRNSADATDGQTAAVERWIEAQGEALGITDDELRPALTRLVTATEDVGEAQDLAALAMDVSAGKQKSLISVSEALAKAEDGQLTALQRLGVKTKDAAGESLTFEEITRNLARTFKGQASESADTASGAYKRLQTRFSELGEDVGYKLLPHLLDVGNWILDEGIPAGEELADQIGDELGPVVRDLAEWVRENRDEMADMAGTARDTLVPVLRTTADVGGEVLEFVMDLPAPLRDIAVQAGVAAAVLPRLTNSIQAMALPMFVTNLRNAETRTAAFGRAARTAAGIGGVLALTQGTQTSSEYLDFLASAAGGAALGFSVGGPWGAAIGTVAGLGTQLYKSKNKAVDFGEALPREKVLEFKDAIDDTTLALSKQGREQILLAAQEAGVLALTTRLGISQRDLLGAVNGNEGATARLNQAYRENVDLLDGNEQATFNTWIRNNTNALAGQRREQDQLNDATTSWAKALKGLPPEVRTAVKAIGADATAEELRRLKRQYDLTPKQIRTVIEALGTEVAIRKIKGVWTVLEDGRKVRTDLGPWLATFTAGMNRGERRAETTADYIDELLNLGDAEPNLAPFDKSLAAQLRASSATGSRGGIAIGNAIQTGVQTGIAGVIQNVAATAAAALAAGIAAAQARGDKGKGKGGRIGRGFGADAEARAEFAGGFAGFQSSIFSAQSEGPMSVADILSFGAGEQAKAEQAKADMAKLIGMGLSPALIKQFQSQGPAGMEILRTLASGANSQQIAMLNAQNVATASAYGGLGELGATAIFGSAGFDPNQQFDTDFGGHGPRGGKGGKGGSRIEARLERLADVLENQELKGTVRIDGKDIVIAIKRYKRDQGGGQLGIA